MVDRVGTGSGTSEFIHIEGLYCGVSESDEEIDVLYDVLEVVFCSCDGAGAGAGVGAAMLLQTEGTDWEST